jgi:hypothetical protein
MDAGIIVSVHGAVVLHVACQVEPAAAALVGSIVILHLGGKLRGLLNDPVEEWIRGWNVDKKQYTQVEYVV